MDSKSFGGAENCQSIRTSIIEHYSASWGEPFVDSVLMRGPARERMPCFSVLSFSPRQGRRLWTYATCGMSAGLADHRVEIHIFSPIASLRHVEALTAIAYYHATERRIGLGDTVNIGRPWLAKSLCEYGLISRPYLDGPKIENCDSAHDEPQTQCLWLIPITLKERDFKIHSGLESLERKFQSSNFKYADPSRESVA
jgi:hypothetical protein